MKDKRQFIYDMCKEAAEKKGIWSQEVEDRLNHELEIISDKGFEDYFLIIQEMIQWAKSQGILVGPGRGSAAGSMVAYLMGITKINPLKYDLYFERFLNPARPDFPDIDTDFQATRRPEVFAHMKERYGEDRTCQISTYSRFHIKQVLRDLCRIFDVPMDVSNKISKEIPEGAKTLKEAMKSSKVKQFLNSHPKIRDLAEDIQGSIRQRSVHAAGLVITPRPISEFMASERVKGQLCSAFDMVAIDMLGILKVDILSLRTLDVIAKALELAGLGEDDLPEEFEDPEVYKVFQEGRTLGVFQFESQLLTGMAQELHISDFKTLYAATTIARPGPLHSGETKKYIARHNKKQKVTYLDDYMKPITEETYGLLLYQEQTMKTSVSLANFAAQQAEKLRKLISKSKGIEALDEYMNMFIDGCVDNSIDKSVAEEIWNVIRESGAYSFNKSHAVSYSAVSYWCAWLKTYYPKEFLTALMVYEEDEIQEKAVRELREAGYKVKSPDINASKESVRIDKDDGNIYMGLSDIEGVGAKAVEEICLHQPYESFDGFLSSVKRRKVNSKVVKNLICAGAFDKFDRRDRLFYSVSDEEPREWGDKEVVERQNAVLDMPSSKPLIDFYECPYDDRTKIVPMKEIDFTQKIDEIWVKGVITNGSTRKSNRPEILPNASMMAYFDLDDGTRKTNCFVAPETLSIFENILSDAEPVLIKAHTFGKKDQLYVDGAVSLEHEELNIPTFMKYLNAKRAGDISKVMSPGMVSVVSSASYTISKNSKAYARVTFDGDGQYLWFDLDAKPICPGEIFVWESKKEPFMNVHERIQ